MAEAFLQGDLFVFLELIRVDVFDNRKMLGSGTKVLAEGEDGDVVGEKVIHGLEYLFLAFTEAEHEAGFGGDVAVDHLLGFLQDGERALVLGTGADERGEAFDGFEVVIEDVRAGVHDQLESPVAVVEIGDEDFDDDVGVDLADGADGFAEVFGTAVLEVIASDGGDDDVLEVHPVGGLGDAGGFVGFEGVGLGGLDRAETAGTGALVPGDHEGGGALPPAFPTVWALGFLADSDQFEVGDQGFGRPESRVVGQANLDPIRFFLPVEGRIHLHFRATGGHTGDPKF